LSPAGGRLLGLLVVALTSQPARAALPEDPHPHTPPPPADVVLVGEDAACAKVEEVVAELLSRAGMAVTWGRQSSFQPQDIFAQRQASPDHHPGVAVWIDLSAPAEARLFFRDAGGDRFFIRSLSLARGIDEMAKEEIAHIVSNAALALTQGGGAPLTRSEARQVLKLQPATDARPDVRERSSTPLRLAVAAMAGGQLFASELPVVARATLSLTLSRGPRWNLAQGAFGGWLDLGYQPPGRYRGSVVGADVEAVSARAGVLWQVGRAVLLRLGLGVGVDRVGYHPLGDTPHVELASASSFYVPMLTAWVGTHLRLLDWLALTSRISLDAAFAKVHFDLHGDQTTRVLVPHPLRPAAVVGLASVF